MARGRARRFRISRVAVLMVAAFALGGARGEAAMSCADLANLKIAASGITLPTSGATVASAQMASVPADPLTPGVTREYCKVVGAIAPVDPNAPPINFEVNLPVQWNGKAVQYGGGGSNGTLVSGLNALRDARRDTPVPIARGFATWGTDSGHQNEKLPEPRAFALNDESFINMAYASYKKTYDVARRVTQAFYDRMPSAIYFYGGSEGGREALMMAQRFPAAFDGIVSVVPVANYVGAGLARTRMSLLQHDGGWISPAKVKLIHNAVTAACDRLDDLADGVISAYEKCTGVFDVRTLRCPEGTDAGAHCLSDKQIEVDRFVHRPFEYPFPLKNGVTAFPGWNYGGEDQPGGMVEAITGTETPQFPIVSERTQSDAWVTGDAFVRLYFARDAKYNTLRFSTADLARRIKEVSEMWDTTDPDLSAFLARGGKLILKGNGADYTRSVLQEIAYYKAVVAKMGQQRADSFIRFYVTPGVNHGGEGVMSGGAAVPSDVDLLGALDGWVDGGKAPGMLTQVAQERTVPFKVVASRPMCLYPQYPRYDGHGDPGAASSFTCVKQ